MEASSGLGIASLVVASLSALFVAVQSIYTRKLVQSTTQAYLEGNLQVSLVPRGASGALNLRVENVGANTISDVKLAFPCGVKAVVEGKVVDIAKSGQIPLELGSMAPHEKREWHLAVTSEEAFEDLPRFIRYEASYGLPSRARRCSLRRNPKLRKISGSLDTRSYRGSLIQAFVGSQDLLLELRKISKALEARSS